MIKMSKDQKFKNCQKYKKYYDSIIEYYKDNIVNTEEIYCEIHHIVPKSLGGSNNKDNKVTLPYRVHVFVHECLFMYYKFSNDEQAYKKMSAALHAMYSNSELGKRKMTHSKKIAFFKQLARQNLDFNARRFSAFGKTLTIREWSAQTGIKTDTIMSRIRAGWDIEDVLTFDNSDVIKKRIAEKKRLNREARYKQLKPMFDEYIKFDNGIDGYMAVVEKFNYALSYPELRRSFLQYVPQYKNFHKSKFRSVIYKGQKLTYAQLAEKFNIDKHALTSRLEDGWDIDDAITIPVGFEMDFDYNRKQLRSVFEYWKTHSSDETCAYFGFEYKNSESLHSLFRKYFRYEYKEIQMFKHVNAVIEGTPYKVLELARKAGVSKQCIYNRIEKGYSEKSLLKKRVISINDPEYVMSKRKKLLPYFGSYNSGGYKAVKRDFPDCPYSATSLRQQFRTYIPDVYRPSEASRIELRNKMGQQIIIDGVTKAIGEWSKESGIPVWKIYQRLKQGVTGKKLLSQNDINVNYIEFKGKMYAGYNQLAKEFGVSRGLILARLRKGETLEQALSRPSNRKHKS